MRKTTNTYSSEVRERAVRMVLDNAGQHESRWSAILSISAKIGCAPQTLNEWVKKGEVDSGDRAGVTTEMAEAGIKPSVGSAGDSYDNALAETSNGLFKADVIHRRGPSRSFDAVEYATLEWVDWFNNRRLLEPIGNISPAEAEANFYAALKGSVMAAKLRSFSLRQTRRGSILRFAAGKQNPDFLSEAEALDNLLSQKSLVAGERSRRSRRAGATKAKSSAAGPAEASQVSLVAGVGFEPTTFRL